MNKTIIGWLEKTAFQLIFALLSGGAYFILALKFILSHTQVAGGLLAAYLSPVIICGAALILIKLFKQCRENENENAIVGLFWIHVLLIIMSAVFAFTI